MKTSTCRTRRVLFALPTDLLQAIDQLAADRAESRASTIRDLLRQALEARRAQQNPGRNNRAQ